MLQTDANNSYSLYEMDFYLCFGGVFVESKIHYRLSFVSLTLASAFSINAAIAQDGGDTAVDLGTMVVTASGFEQSIKQAPASISVITREEMQQKSISSLTDALTDIPGVDVEASAGKTGGLNVSIRGMPSDYTLILIDGRRQNAAGNITPNGFGETSTSFLPPINSIERIEVIRGPMSTLYGSDAMGGVVNIITRKVSDKWHGSVTADTTFETNKAGDSRKFDLYLSGPIIEDRLGLTLRGSKFKRDASEMEPTGDHGDSTISSRGPNPVEADIHSFGARLTLTPNNNHDIWLDFESSRQKYDNRNAQLGTIGVRGYEEYQRFNQDQYTLAHTGRLGWGTLDSSIMYSTRETLGRTIPEGTPGKTPGSARELESNNLVFDTKLTSLIGNHMLTVGGQYWKAEMKDGVAPAPYEHKQYALFAEDEWQITDSFAATFGLRYDHHDIFGSHVSPRAYAVWNVNDNWILKGGVGRGYKTPRLDQLTPGINGFRGQGTIPTIGTPTLKPETSTNFEIGAIYDTNNGFMVGVTAFHNEFEDRITSGIEVPNCSWADNPNRPGCVDHGYWPATDYFGQTVNVDKAITQGIELTTTIAITDALTLNANYTYLDSEQKSGADKGKPLSDASKHSVNAKLNWIVDDKLTTWVRGSYRSSRYRSDDHIREQLGNYKSYATVDLGAAYKISKNVTISASINNLFDKDFLEYANYTDSRGQAAYGPLYTNMKTGRNFWLSMNAQF